MATLERVMQLKQQGMSESQIASALRQEGISPKEIIEAISQSKIKTSINNENSPDYSNDNLYQSMMTPQEEQPQYPVQNNYPAPDASQSYGPPPVPQSYEEQPSPQETQTMPELYQEYYPQYTGEYSEYQPQKSIDIETINDIAEQIVEEKISDIKKQNSSLKKFKEEIAMHIEKISQRLDKIENEFNELQMAVIKKVGGYGESINEIAREMNKTQESFSKIIDPLTDNIRKLQEINEGRETFSKPSPSQENQQSSQREKTLKKKSSDFEDYLR